MSLTIDDKLLKEARRLGGHATKCQTVNEALKEYIANLKRVRALEDFGSIDFDPAYNFKRDRRRR